MNSTVWIIGWLITTGFIWRDAFRGEEFELPEMFLVVIIGGILFFIWPLALGACIADLTRKEAAK